MSINNERSSHPARRLALIGVPSSAGARRTGQEKAPGALRAAGLAASLRERGLDVEDLGDLPVAPFRPDPGSARLQNAGRVAEVARRTAGRVGEALAAGRWPVILGGDCTIALGAVSALLQRHPRLGLLYFDGDADLNTPETTASGILDGMVLAHLLGRGDAGLAGIGPRRPLLAEEDVVLFGVDPSSGWIDPAELEALEGSRMSRHLREAVQEDPAGSAREALRPLEGREAFLLHFDVDVTRMDAADVPHPGGLEPGAAFTALGLLAGSPRCAGILVTELNVDEDPGGSQCRLLARGLAGALAGGASGRGPAAGGPVTGPKARSEVRRAGGRQAAGEVAAGEAGAS